MKKDLPKEQKIKKPSNKETNSPERKEDTFPIGLLILQDWISRFPEKKEQVLEYELNHRENEHILLTEIKKMLSWHPWSTFRLLLITGGVTFSLAWSLSALSDVVQIYNETIGRLTTQLPNFADSLTTVTKLLPKADSPIFAFIPEYGAVESIYFALIVIGLIVIIKSIVIFFNWKRIQILTKREYMLEKEIHALKEMIEQEQKERNN